MVDARVLALLRQPKHVRNENNNRYNNVTIACRFLGLCIYRISHIRKIVVHILHVEHPPGIVRRLFSVSAASTIIYIFTITLVR